MIRLARYVSQSLGLGAQSHGATSQNPLRQQQSLPSQVRGCFTRPAPETDGGVREGRVSQQQWRLSAASRGLVLATSTAGLAGFSAQHFSAGFPGVHSQQICRLIPTAEPLCL